MAKKSKLFLIAFGLFLLSIPTFLITGQEIKSTTVRARWMLDIAVAPPKVFTYTSTNSEKQNYCYIIYQISNSTDDKIKLGIDICVRAILDEQKPEKDRYYQEAIQPLVEEQIIISEEGLEGLNPQLQKDRIKQLKKELKYLNRNDLRNKGEIKPEDKTTQKPKETIKGLVIFNEFDPQTIKLEVMVGGLVDVIKWRYEPVPDPNSSLLEDRLVYEYECKIFKSIYECPGDEAWEQTREIREVKKEWLVKNYGPLAEKQSLESMLESLSDPNPLLRWTGWYLLNRLTGLSFDYAPIKSVEDNEKSIKRWNEWWHRNKENIVYDSVLNKFEVREPVNK